MSIINTAVRDSISTIKNIGNVLGCIESPTSDSGANFIFNDKPTTIIAKKIIIPGTHQSIRVGLSLLSRPSAGELLLFSDWFTSIQEPLMPVTYHPVVVGFDHPTLSLQVPEDESNPTEVK